VPRPLKDGVGYFPKDTDFYQDYKVRLLRAQFGAKGMYLLDYLLCEIYGKNGYYLPWNEDVCLLVADAVGCECSPQFIGELIIGATKCSFFDKRVLDAFSVLTSAGIQRRYIRMFNSREKIQIIREYWLLNNENVKDVPTNAFDKLVFISDKSTENPVKSTENPVKSTENSIKENKEKQRKGKQSKDARVRATPLAPPTIADVAEYCRQRKNNINPQKFFDYFNAGNWIDSKGNPVINWKQKVISWENHGIKDGPSPTFNVEDMIKRYEEEEKNLVEV